MIANSTNSESLFLIISFASATTCKLFCLRYCCVTSLSVCMLETQLLPAQPPLKLNTNGSDTW